MRYPKAPPISADINSKLGTSMAIMTATAATKSRKKPLRRCVSNLDWLKRFGFRRAARGSTPEKTSKVETIGAALKFLLVRKQIEQTGCN